MKPERLANIEQKAQPWRGHEAIIVKVAHPGFPLYSIDSNQGWLSLEKAQFVKSAFKDIPDLCDYIRQLQRRNGELEQRLDRANWEIAKLKRKL